MYSPHSHKNQIEVDVIIASATGIIELLKDHDIDQQEVELAKIIRNHTLNND
jgi:hypothetical protein